MKNLESNNKCNNCGKYSDILVSGFCVKCFEEFEKNREIKNPLDKFEFEQDEYEELETSYIKKDEEEKNKNNMIVHSRPSMNRAINKIIKVSKSKKK
ncbi:MAG: hypothetical protein PHH83_03700 [Patescibacteria group bacterium]|nr:hypothetical protein [Patescibacteria group bacterium]